MQSRALDVVSDRKQLKDQVYLKMAKVAGIASKCPRRQFGALLVSTDGRLKGHGYNGTIAGGPNLCGGDCCLRDELVSGTRPDVGCIHAEMNLLINCERRDIVGGTVYVNGEPCLMCAKLLAQGGVARVVCIDGGYSTQEGVDLLLSNGVEVERLPPEAIE